MGNRVCAGYCHGELDPGRAACDAARQQWRVRGPFCETWPIHHVVRASDGTLYAGGGSNWYGATVFRSDDDGATWSQSSAGLTYGDDQPKITHIWHVAPTAD